MGKFVEIVTYRLSRVQPTKLIKVFSGSRRGRCGGCVLENICIKTVHNRPGSLVLYGDGAIGMFSNDQRVIIKRKTLYNQVR